jgi:hypothetical protein
MNQMERAMLVHCLRVAATKFDDDALLVPGVTDITERLAQMSAHARALADRLEHAAHVKLGREVRPE